MWRKLGEISHLLLPLCIANFGSKVAVGKGGDLIKAWQVVSKTSCAEAERGSTAFCQGSLDLCEGGLHYLIKPGLGSSVAAFQDMVQPCWAQTEQQISSAGFSCVALSAVTIQMVLIQSNDPVWSPGGPAVVQRCPAWLRWCRVSSLGAGTRDYCNPLFEGLCINSLDKTP